MFSFSGFFNSIILLGTLQGFIVCCLLFYSKKNKLPDRLLAKLIFLMSLASLNLYLHENDKKVPASFPAYLHRPLLTSPTPQEKI